MKPYVKTNKNDVADAEAICEAVARPNMRFVPIKGVEQQTVLALHRARPGFVKARTAQANQIRGLLGEFGLVIPPGIWKLSRRVPGLLEETSSQLADTLCQLVQRLLDHLKELDRQVGENWSARSSNGTEIALHAGNWLRYPESVRLRQVRW